jgi:hypothetical protein
MKVLVVTGDTKEKRYNPEKPLTMDDLLDRDRTARREQELSAYRSLARNMFQGIGHLQMMEGLNRLWRRLGKETAELFIVSAGYGLVNGSYRIVPYQPIFVGMGLKEIDRWSKYLKIPEGLDALIHGYQLAFFLLGREHLRAAGLPRPLPDDVRAVFFASGSFPSAQNTYSLSCSSRDAEEFGFPPSGLKGYLFRLLCQEIIGRGPGLLDEIYRNPKVVGEVLTKYRKNGNRQYQLNFG